MSKHELPPQLEQYWDKNNLDWSDYQGNSHREITLQCPVGHSWRILFKDAKKIVNPRCPLLF